MRPGLAVAAILLAASPAIAHRLDEYLQATLISVEKDRIQAQIRLTPGIAVLPIVLANIDRDGDGAISPAEQTAYAAQVLRDIQMTLNHDPVRPRIVSMQFPTVEEMKEGRGEIQLEIVADAPRNARNRRLTFENHHQPAIAAYLVNCIVPRDREITITAQDRDYRQSFYALTYADAGAEASHAWDARAVAGLAIVALLLSARLATAVIRPRQTPA